MDNAMDQASIEKVKAALKVIEDAVKEAAEMAKDFTEAEMVLFQYYANKIFE